MSTAESARLAVVISHPTQYYSPWFRWLQSHTSLTFRVFYLWDFGIARHRDPQFQTDVQWDVDLLSGYDSEFVSNVARDPGTHHFWGLRNPSLTARLSAWDPDAMLIFGYNWASHLRAVAWALRHRVPIVFRGDSHFLGRGPPGWARRLLLRLLFRRFDAVACVGKANRAYFEHLGVPPERLFNAPHSVNHELFDPLDPRHREAAARLRIQLGLAPEERVVLYAGKLVAAKQPRELLEAFLALDLPDASLIFVGDGEEKAALVDRAAAAPRRRVHFLPFANQSEMPARYLLADLLVLPSRGLYETWGLAVNEAMHMGVPALVSDRVGCQQDLVTPGDTGWVFRSGDAVDLRAQLGAALSALAAPGMREHLSAAVEARISGYTYVQTTDGFLRALASVCSA